MSAALAALRHTAQACAIPLLMAAALPACSDDPRQARAEADGATRPPPPPPYVVVEGAGGRISGTIVIEGDVPADTIVRPTSDQRVCGQTLLDVTIRRSGDRLAGVVVWLDDARQGKRLPLERRYAVTNENCMLVPRVQAALVGGTLNVRSADPVIHRTRIARASGEVLRIVQHDDAGQVVPVQGLFEEPGWLRLSSDVHPWTVGWIAVFDHPYFDVTARDGAFSFDSVPPGRYILAARHERLGEVRTEVVVGEGQETSVQIGMGRERRVAAPADASRPDSAARLSPAAGSQPGAVSLSPAARSQPGAVSLSPAAGSQPGAVSPSPPRPASP